MKIMNEIYVILRKFPIARIPKEIDFLTVVVHLIGAGVKIGDEFSKDFEH